MKIVPTLFFISAAALLLLMPVHNAAFGQFAASTPAVATPAETTGGVIHLAAFGWIEPYVDTFVQLLITAIFGILAKSKYAQWLDQSSRDALETFAKNRASSLLADGAVKIENKSVKVNSSMLYRAAAESATAIPDALKRFGLTPQIVAEKIIDAIPQTTAGAAILASAHEASATDPVPVTNRLSAAPAPASA